MPLRYNPGILCCPEFSTELSTGVRTGMGGHHGAENVRVELNEPDILQHIVDLGSRGAVDSPESRHGRDVDVCEDVVEEFIRQDCETSGGLESGKHMSADIKWQAGSQALHIEREQRDVGIALEHHCRGRDRAIGHACRGGPVITTQNRLNPREQRLFSVSYLLPPNSR